MHNGVNKAPTAPDFNSVPMELWQRILSFSSLNIRRLRLVHRKWEMCVARASAYTVTFDDTEWSKECIDHVLDMKRRGYQIRANVTSMRHLPAHGDALARTVTHMTVWNNCALTKALPATLLHLEFEWSFDQEIHAGYIPPSVTHLKFSVRFNKPLGARVLPPYLKELVFECSEFDHPLEVGALPHGLERLVLWDGFNQKIEAGMFPQSLRVVEFGDAFDQPFRPGDLPNHLTQLSFGDAFNQLLRPRDLPDTLTHLSFGKDFDQVLNARILPRGLRYLMINLTTCRRLSRKDLPTSLSLRVGGWSSW